MSQIRQEVGEPLLVAINSLAHLGLKIVTLIDADDASEASRHVIQETLRDFQAHAEARHVGRERPSEVVVREALYATFVERQLHHTEAGEGFVHAPGWE